MKRTNQKKHNQIIINNIARMLTYSYSRPSYRTVCRVLNDNELTSSVGNVWTERSIYRMLQRNGYSGLWGLQKFNVNSLKKEHFTLYKKGIFVPLNAREGYQRNVYETDYVYYNHTFKSRIIFCSKKLSRYFDE